MPYYLLHAGSKLQKVSIDGSVVDVSLPSGVTMSTTLRSRFAMLNSSILAAQGPSLNLRIRASDMASRAMSLVAPASVPTVAAGSAGALTGVRLYKTSFVERVAGAIVSESPLSSASLPVTLAAQRAALSSLPTTSQAGVTDLRIYSTTLGGAVYFPNGFVTIGVTTYSDNVTDAALGDTSEDLDLGNPAGTTTADYLTLLTVWRDRAWAVSNTEPDDVRYSGVNKFYAWSASNSLPINPKGQATSGVTAFLTRRDEFGVAKRRSISKIIGNSASNYQVVNVISGVGVIAPESVVVIRDTAYFLAEDGPYAWDSSGVTPLATDRVAAWFNTDDYFNRGRFSNAFAVWNQHDDTYELHLSARDGNTENRWVSFDLQRKLWLGPHKSDAFTPTCAAATEDSDGRSMLLVGGSDSKVYRANDAIAKLDGSTAIDLDIDTILHSGGEPTLEKYFGALTVLTKPQTAGTLSVTPTVGVMGATAQSALTHDLTLGRERLPRLGTGELLTLRFRQNTADQDCQIFGYEVVPVSLVGQR